ncbi:hypothetical protein [Streptosporangium canum]|uniref:hypothetical protein n=1 Tax=Streptosporangium canum TaxID=324952 RepID=UPI003787DCAA
MGNEIVLNKDVATRTWYGVLSVLGSPIPPKQQAAVFRIANTPPGIEMEEFKEPLATRASP